MTFKKNLFPIVAITLVELLCSCYSNKSLNYDFGEAEGYRFYSGFSSTLSDGTDKKNLFDSIEIEGTNYVVDTDYISTFYYEDYVACIYNYNGNQWAIINYDIKNDDALLIETYSAESVRFIVPNYYPTFCVTHFNGTDYSLTYHLLHHSKIITSENGLQSINSFGYFSLNKNNTEYTSFSDGTSFEFGNAYRAIYNISNLDTVYLYCKGTENVDTVSFNCLSFEKQEIDSYRFGQIEKAIPYKNVDFRNEYCSIWIENFDNSLYLNGLGLDKALIMETPDDYLPSYHLEYYKEFNCITVSSPYFEFTYSVDYKSFSQKIFIAFKDESFKYRFYENEKFVFECENIYTRLHPTGSVELDTYFLRYDKEKNKYEIMQKKHVYGFSDVFAFDYILEPYEVDKD